MEPSIPDQRDEGTPDEWINRNPALIRLTGKHPFNAEPPLPALMQQGFITPVPLHFVRNHGPVPTGELDRWTVEITGLVNRPARFPVTHLMNDFPPLELPVTLVFSGNRRHEMNMVKRSMGFNWGAAALSTSVWRGARLRDVLNRCEIFSRERGALNVCFEGADSLPGGGGGGAAGSNYGTSLRREVAMDPTRDVMIAYMQNGEFLTPDHGFPVRMIIPGFIGGRMVKWLKRIIVTTDESQNYYHFRDNRLLPSHVDAELADRDAWWYKPEYIITELNINSVITSPAHQELIPVNSATTQQPCTLRGYAYSGGGKKVTRVEVTTNGGEFWMTCKLEHLEKPNEYGKYWCWCFWSLEVDILYLVGDKEVCVRAWDETTNTQPETLSWNILGMMNNCWFRLKTHLCKTHNGEVGIVFEHPTFPGNHFGGWMEKQNKLVEPLDNHMIKSSPLPIMRSPCAKFSTSEVKKHNSQNSLWIVIQGYVYDCTNFFKHHPGGINSILINGGTDCTDEFEAIHSSKAKKMLEEYCIGELIMSENEPLVLDYSGYKIDTTSNSERLVVNGTHLLANIALTPNIKISCKLFSKTKLSHNVRLLRFSLPFENQILGLPIGKHIVISTKIDGELCNRAYTPISPAHEYGHFDLLVKVYFKSLSFPRGGLMSQHLDSLPVNSLVDVKGPLGHIAYIGKGNFEVNGKKKYAQRLALLAGGTGITPIYQIIQAIISDSMDDTNMYLVYANHTEDDILLQGKLDEWSRMHPNFHVWYVVKRAREDWRYSNGLITQNILQEHIPVADSHTMALLCGPSAMVQAVSLLLKMRNYDIENSVVIF